MARTGIGLFLRSLENDYQQRLRDDAIATAGRLGFKVDVFAAQNDAGKQCQQIAAALEARVNGSLAAVLVSPVLDDALTGPARATASAGIAWGLLNREPQFIEPLRAEFDDLAIFSVTPDQAGIGHVQAEQVRALVPGGGTVLYVTGPLRTSSARLRLEGMQRELAEDGWTLIRVEADWTSEGARLAVDRWLPADPTAAPAPSIVCAQNDDMALGARQALRDAASRTNQPALAAIPITGVDGSPGFGQRLVREKRIAATVAVPSAAGAAIEWIARNRSASERPPLQVTLAVGSFPELNTLARTR